MAFNNIINTAALGTGFVYNNGTGLLSAGPGIKITKYTANDTWTKDAQAQIITIISWNSGSGGGSGRQGSSTAAGGGASGAPGNFVIWTSIASMFNSSETVTVPAGGAGGLTQGSAASNGNAGTIGSVSSLGNIKCAITGNAFGGGGTTTTVSAGAAQTSYIVSSYTVANMSQQPTSGGSNVASSNANGWSYSVNNASYGNGGGAGGSGADSGTERQAGNGQGICFPTTTNSDLIATGGAGGLESGTINGGAGSANISTTGGRFIGATGGGGGGGQSIGAAAGIGGAGGAGGGGGGGGGGSIDGTTSGAGGAGGRGELWVIEYLG